MLLRHLYANSYTLHLLVDSDDTVVESCSAACAPSSLSKTPARSDRSMLAYSRWSTKAWAHSPTVSSRFLMIGWKDSGLR